jgi:hypothetical protein
VAWSELRIVGVRGETLQDLNHGSQRAAKVLVHRAQVFAGKTEEHDLYLWDNLHRTRNPIMAPI